VKKNGFYKWFQTSAKQNLNIEKAGNELVTEIIRRMDKLELKKPKRTDSVQLRLGDSDVVKKRKRRKHRIEKRISDESSTEESGEESTCCEGV